MSDRPKKIWISPSNLAFLYAQCPRCVWLHHRQVKRPSGDFADFRMLDAVQKKALPTGTDLTPVGIPGKVHSSSKKICSVDYGSDGIEARIFGEYDLLVELTAGGFAVVDLKSARPSEEKRILYTKQLSSYGLALTEPDRHMPMDIRCGYLLCWYPETATFIPDSSCLMLDMRCAPMEVEIDLPQARQTVREIVDLVKAEKPPASSPECPHCSHARKVLALAKADLKEEVVA